jgi:hypothetical protein
MSDEKKSWREIFKVHPAAELFPPLPEDELRKLGEDIQKNGLQEPIILWAMQPEGPYQVLDGINRLDAMELVGMETLEQVGKEWRLMLKPRYLSWVKDPFFPAHGGINPYTYAMSANVHRRHMTKLIRAELIVKATELEEEQKRISPSLARSVERYPDGRFGGSAKDEFKEKVVERAKHDGVSQRTIERALAQHRGPVFERERPVNPLDEFNVKEVIEIILNMLEPASELEVRQVVNAIQKRFLAREQTGIRE